VKIAVRRGDTLDALLLDYGVSKKNLRAAADLVVAANRLRDANTIRAGSKLTFPDSLQALRTVGEAAPRFEARVAPGAGSLRPDGSQVDRSGVGVPTVRIGEGPEDPRPFANDGRFVFDVVPQNGVSERQGRDRKTYTFEWSFDTLRIDDRASGAKRQIVASGQAAIEQMQKDHAAELRANAEPGPTSSWSYSEAIAPAGAVGDLVSLRHTYADFMGGAHPNHMSQLTTYDAGSGAEVSLRELLSDKQFAYVVREVERQLARHPEGRFYGDGDRADEIAKRFAIYDDGGVLRIQVALHATVHAMGDAEARFTFAAPTDAGFRERLESNSASVVEAKLGALANARGSDAVQARTLELTDWLRADPVSGRLDVSDLNPLVRLLARRYAEQGGKIGGTALDAGTPSGKAAQKHVDALGADDPGHVSNAIDDAMTWLRSRAGLRLGVHHAVQVYAAVGHALQMLDGMA
jgi:hypothetical protein